MLRRVFHEYRARMGVVKIDDAAAASLNGDDPSKLTTKTENRNRERKQRHEMVRADAHTAESDRLDMILGLRTQPSPKQEDRLNGFTRKARHAERQQLTSNVYKAERELKAELQACTDRDRRNELREMIDALRSTYAAVTRY